ncbi:MAG: hypothetical protein ACD_38C00176G0002 [uncultured bacterium]|uniref:Uncharacterized protein n=1 Tax=Candidatus Daviesbacteria bacterium GW2011_GWC2_40_12 TaxID=1618431 RepID=A0A0G0QP40_9BACT|nr:MAG: hypothetical protein ACD_38C00176G0002 [uncultured bacterium]KKR17104.1 MAG: hypothetical protein UT45_C0003G0134 [Candidatus Daviesbacteria bacterium GW2011_GWA2_39_33]KKR42169.1 MAG: hypothetical protein UT77_C0004G0153 [Candidatus Daviesbacteria bacterium GW2011_GWC2_40_12]OGE20928.1 MAG: hypothetical protein A2778_06715 [Candidatus Daviesbacteria bacterium RIFCSPHIGHO2_01_FULL_40_24]OGE28280.1 MAG: hypothetical protein A3C29_04735 [Candidatus Daviesbacteria bacterium RIFCSPHIGHO2_02
MAYQQTAKLSDLEKRLQILRRQVYGKNSENSERIGEPVKSENQLTGTGILTHQYSGAPSHSESFRTDFAYLRHDLAKILILSSMAIGAQISLFFLLKNNLLNLRIF